MSVPTENDSMSYPADNTQQLISWQTEQIHPEQTLNDAFANLSIGDQHDAGAQDDDIVNSMLSVHQDNLNMAHHVSIQDQSRSHSLNPSGSSSHRSSEDQWAALTIQLALLKMITSRQTDRARAFNNVGMDPRAAIREIDEYKRELDNLVSRLEVLSNDLTRAAVASGNLMPFNDLAEVDDILRESLRYLSLLRHGIMTNQMSMATETTFESAIQQPSQSPRDPHSTPPELRTQAPEDRLSSTSNPAPNDQLSNEPEIVLGTRHPTSRNRTRTLEQQPQAPVNRDPIDFSMPTQPPTMTPMSPTTGAGTLEIHPTAAREDPMSYLPKLANSVKLPNFNGDVKRYREFTEMFDAFIDRRPIPAVQKLVVLRNSLSGRALNLVRHLSLIPENYDVTRQLLKESFGQDDMAENQHLNEMDRILSTGGELNYDKLPSFVALISQHILALLSINHTYQSLSAAYSNRIMNRLPFDIRRLALVHIETNTHVPKLEALLGFLRRESFRVECLRQGQNNPKRQPSASTQPRASSNTPHGFRGSHDRLDPRPVNPEAVSFKRTFDSYHLAAPPIPLRHVPDAPERKQKVPCIFCEADHSPYKCNLQLTHAERRERAIAARACLKCLKLNHEAKNCRDGPRSKCKHCNGNHYSIMCKKAPINSNERSTVHATSLLNDGGAGTPDCLWTAHVWAETDNRRVPCRILIDPGSQSSHVTASLVKKLNSKPSGHIDLSLATAGGKVSSIFNCGIHNLVLRSMHHPEKYLRVQTFELDCLTRSKFPIMQPSVDFSPLADIVPDHQLNFVDILLGHQYISKIGFADPKSLEDAFAFNSIFGWIVGGSPQTHASVNYLQHFCGFELVQPGLQISETRNEPGDVPIVTTAPRKIPKAHESTLEDIRFLWHCEDIGSHDEIEKSEEKDSLNEALIAHYNKTSYRDRSGRIVVRLPFKENIRSLGDNEALSRSRLQSFIAKLSKNQTRLKAVDEEMQGYLDAGFAELAPPKKKDQMAHYLPIQAVFKLNPDSPFGFKTRVVKDASARRSHEASLNDVLHSGPNLLPDILIVIMKFREYKFVVTADIEKAFLQNKIAKPDRTFLRFLWPLGISSNKHAKVREFQAKRLDFGLSSSPFLHCQGIRNLLASAATKFPQDADFIQEIASTFFMDDIVAGADSLIQAKHRIDLLFSIFGSAKFPLKKWSSNAPQLGKYVREVSPVKDPVVTTDQTNATFLGVLWNQKSDTLTAPTSTALRELHSGKPSKRKLLSGLAKVFDPLGIIAPVTMNGKILLQELWKAKSDWDTPLTTDKLEKYNDFVNLLNKTGSVSIPRNLNPSSSRKVIRQIHMFCDASLAAYGCVAYLRTEIEGETPSVNFIIAKGKVAPVRPMSVQRLELLGALLSARVLKNLLSALNFRIDSTHLYSDNSSVLAWVKSSPEKWKPFVANRIRRIHQLIGQANWEWIESESNPSDIISRGRDVSGDLSSLWFSGPQWLRLNNHELKEKRERDDISNRRILNVDLDAEKKLSVSSLLIANNQKPGPDRIFFEDHFSCWRRAIRFWALMSRWIGKARKTATAEHDDKTTTDDGPIHQVSPEEMIAARQSLIQLTQKIHFREEYESKCSQIKPSSPLYQLAPFIDNNGLIRCRSRLGQSKELSENQKFPILLPYGSGFSKLIIKEIHEHKCFHSGGMNHVLQFLRRDFLILKARSLTRQVLKACATCKIFHAEPASLPMASLPSHRIDTAPPFHYTGIDFAGPFRYKKESGEIAKSYILVMTCNVTRAVHIELTLDMSTVEVLGALQKFVNRFPSVHVIISDNGLSFQRASKELKLIYEHVKDGDIKRWLANSFITWKFITPHAPWFGGYYERMVQSIKRPLRKVLGTAIPHFRDLEVILSGIEAMINSRPLTTVASGNDSTEALSPSDLLFGYRGTSLIPQHALKPQKASDADKVVFSQRWKYQQRILNSYWKRFQTEYLAYLRSAHNRKPVEDRPLKIGDICLLEDTKNNRALWPLCRVIAFPENSKPELSRSCTIRTARGQIFNRPIKKLYPIEHAA